MTICKNCGIDTLDVSDIGWCKSCIDEWLNPTLHTTPLDKTETISSVSKKKRRRRSKPNARKIWSEHFRVKIPKGYHIHHKDKNPFNNDPNNLLCLPLECHIKLHDMNGDIAAVTILKKMK